MKLCVSKDVLIVYGSQTGQSQAIAELIAEKLLQEGIESRLDCLNNADKKAWAIPIIPAIYDALQQSNGGCLNWEPKSFTKVDFAMMQWGLKIKHTSTSLELVADPWIAGVVPTVKNILASLSAESENSTPITMSNMNATPISPIAPPVDTSVQVKPPIDQQIELAANRLSLCSLAASADLLERKRDLPILSVAFDGELKVPAASPAFLQVSFGSKFLDCSTLPHQNGCEFSSQGSNLFEVPVVKKNFLTKFGAKKEKYEIFVEFSAENTNAEFKPGDAFYFLCPNSDEEIDFLFAALGLKEKADVEATLSVLEETKKRNPSVPAFLSNPGTLRHWFKTSLDFRKPISKTLLRILADFCENDEEKRKMLALCSVTNTQFYVQNVLQAKLSLLDILHSFASCKPPVERLLENLPRLAARPYSVASFQPNGKEIRFVFSLVKIPAGEGRFYDRLGLATGFLTKVELKQKVPIFLKKPTNFHLPTPLNPNVPLLLIGPGTGIAPFLGFLDELASKQLKLDACWLFFGCRNESLDFIYKQELENFCSAKILTKLLVAFSDDNKDGKGPRYVQDLLRLHSSEIVDLLKNDGIVYVCGDAQGMAVDVHKMFHEILKSVEKMNDLDASNYLEKMRCDLRYRQDIWT